MKKILAFICAAAMILGLSGCGAEANLMPEEIYDHVFDVGTITKLDYKYAQEFFEKTYDQWEKDGGIPMKWIPNAGHNSNTDHPELVNALIEEFLNAHM